MASVPMVENLSTGSQSAHVALLTMTRLSSRSSIIEWEEAVCGRFVRFTSWAELRQKLCLLTSAELPPSYNIAPTQQVLVAREQEGRREGVAMRWGLIPSWAKDKKAPQINARAETVAEKPMFRAAFKKRRCLVLADGYYEWKKAGKQKQPFYYRLKDEQPFTFAGIWETWHGEARLSAT
jgi:putative SOS response-associated peptidase YedK